MQRTSVQATSSILARPPSCAQLGQRRRRQRQPRSAAAVRAGPEPDLDDQLQADLERLRQRQAATGSGGAQQQAAPAARQAASGGSGEGGGLKEAVDKILIADFFFILFALAWLGAALAERSVLQSTRLLDTWLSLWQWVFQPAIGVLMLGAIVSGAAGWAKDNLGKQR